MLLLEIGLTGWAWRRGWKGWALLPLIVGVLAGMLLGASVGAAGGSAEDVNGMALILDLACIGTLILMGLRGREVTSRSLTPGTTQPQEVAGS